ncbi:hypothetical protein MMC21_001906 [Puttea exsequens]|nr:hypothetical protein [Puttea exsequens]
MEDIQRYVAANREQLLADARKSSGRKRRDQVVPAKNGEGVPENHMLEKFGRDAAGSVGNHMRQRTNEEPMSQKPVSPAVTHNFGLHSPPSSPTPTSMVQDSASYIFPVGATAVERPEPNRIAADANEQTNTKAGDETTHKHPNSTVERPPIYQRTNPPY